MIKCKMCGGDLVLTEGQSVAECEYCGSMQTVPSADNEKKLTLFSRADRLRAACDFDKAAGVYESLVAEFPTEAEAYWGLVLCKYGIEYVDDPGTGRKIPTCHRSSFESIMDDPNFEQTLENADVAARKVYRDEAKQIEEIRKGIIAVSSNEQPYDIFICYKETAADGNRTIDSVLAQDIYDALTERDYRVFFARITLEDKLGSAYEPYIFAALNSAKIMLTIGTDYEYFNAVWVKNEWSRYLKLMAADKSKHLIPCYKDIDAYDMPKEFRHLQAQDLGKVGATQDLLRGIEKIIPRKVQQQTVIVQQQVAAGDSAAVPLKRGHIALEDRDWKSALKFFEEALNKDPECAEAYVGKALTIQSCTDIMALARLQLAKTQEAKSENKEIPEVTTHIQEMIAKFAVDDYLSASEIRKMYQFSRRYESTAESRRKQRDELKAEWGNHTVLARAAKYATGSLAEELKKAKDLVFTTADARYDEAVKRATDIRKNLQEAYDEHVRQCDENVRKLFNAATEQREQEYMQAAVGANSTDIAVLQQTAKDLEKFGNYRDTKALITACNDKVVQLQQAQKETQIKENKKKRRKGCVKGCLIAILTPIILFAILIGIALYQQNKENKSLYNAAVRQVEDGQYDNAIHNFEMLAEREYEDSADKVLETKYLQADATLKEGLWETAYTMFEELGDYSDAAARMEDCIAVRDAENEEDYQTGIAYFRAGDYESGSRYLTHGYKDATDYLNYAQAREAGDTNIFDEYDLYAEFGLSDSFLDVGERKATIEKLLPWRDLSFVNEEFLADEEYYNPRIYMVLHFERANDDQINTHVIFYQKGWNHLGSDNYGEELTALLLESDTVSFAEEEPGDVLEISPEQINLERYDVSKDEMEKLTFVLQVEETE